MPSPNLGPGGSKPPRFGLRRWLYRRPWDVFSNPVLLRRTTAVLFAVRTSWKNVGARYQVVIQGVGNVGGRFRLVSSAVKNVGGRYVLRGSSWKNAPGRYSLVGPTTWKNAGVRFRLSILAGANAPTRYRLVVAPVQDVAARFVLQVRGTANAKSRYRIGATAWKNVGARYRVQLPAHGAPVPGPTRLSHGSLYQLKRSDTAPSVRDVLLDRDGNPCSLILAAVQFHVVNRLGAVVVNRPATGWNGAALDASGQVEYAWQPGEVAAAGEFFAEWQVTFANGQIQSWPTTDQLIVQITPDLA